MRALSLTGILRTYANHTAIREGPDVHGVWVDPLPLEGLADEIRSLAGAAKVDTTRIPGYWLYKDASHAAKGAVEPPRDGEKVIYAMHGGGYVFMSAHPNDPSANVDKALLRKLDLGPNIQRAFSIEYRLSTVTPFPSQLLDALAGYQYLVNTVGFSPKDIILQGDSAGGHLALSLARYIAEFAPELKPGGMFLLSPWCDLSAKGQDVESMYFESDYIQRRYPHVGIYLTGPFGLGMAETSRWISPALPEGTWSFKGFPKTLILAGGAEIFRDQIRELKKKLERDLGSEEVQYLELADAVHDWIIFPGFEPEAQQGLDVIAEWIRVQLQ